MHLDEDPLFSVIIPWHANADYLARAAASAGRQTERDFELIIVCNGPAFGVPPESLGALQLPPHRLLRSEPADANAARNTGIDHARGAWLAFLDADDEFEPGKLARLRLAIARNEADIFLSRGKRVRGAKNISVFPKHRLKTGDNLSEYFFSTGSNCSTSAIAVRSETARAVRFTPGLAKFQDNDFLIRSEAAGAGIRMLDDCLFIWHDSSEAGRISRGTDYERQMQWAKSLAPAFTEKAYHAFCARRVAQYIFPRGFLRNGLRFWNGWRRGGLSALETGLMIVRALLPAGLARRGVGLYAGFAQRKTGHDLD